MDTRLLFLEAEKKRSAQEWHGAVPLYCDILKVAPDAIGARCGLSICYRELGDVKASEDILLEGIRLVGNPYWFLIELSLLERQKGNLEKALEVCEQAIAREPTTPAGYVWKHTYLGALGRENEQILNRIQAQERIATFPQIESHFQITPDTGSHSYEQPTNLLELARTLRAEDRTEEAISALRQHIHSTPRDIGAWIDLIEILAIQRRFDEATTELRIALDIMPDNEWLLLHECRIIELQGNTEAAESMETAISHRFPNNVVPYIRKAERACGKRDYDVAITACERAIQIEPKNYWALALLARALRETGKTDYAATVAEQISVLHPHDEMAYLFLAEYYQESHNLHKALTFLLRGLSAIPNGATILRMTVFVLTQIKDYQGAFLLLESHLHTFCTLVEKEKDPLLPLLQVCASLPPTLESHERIIDAMVASTRINTTDSSLKLACHLFVSSILLDSIRIPAGNVPWPQEQTQREVVAKLCQNTGAYLGRVIATAETFFPHLAQELQRRLNPFIISVLGEIFESGQATPQTMVLLILFRFQIPDQLFRRHCEQHRHLCEHLSPEDWFVAFNNSAIQQRGPAEASSFLSKTLVTFLPSSGTAASIYSKLIVASVLDETARQSLVTSAAQEFLSEPFASNLEGQLKSPDGSLIRLLTLFFASRIPSLPIPKRLVRELATAMPLAMRRHRIASSPRTSPIPETPKIAFCISGQIRNISEVSKNWSTELFAGCEPHIFLHTWNTIRSKAPDHFSLNHSFSPSACKELKSIWMLDHGVKIWELYPTLSSCISSPRPTPSKEHLAEMYHTRPSRVFVEDEDLPIFAGWTNQDKMAHKIKAAHTAMTSEGEQFDLVVRMRPDALFKRDHTFSWRNIAERLKDGLTLSLRNHPWISNRIFNADDTFAIGTPAVMALYAHYSTTRQCMVSAGVRWPDDSSGHFGLGTTMWFYGLVGEPTSGLSMQLVRNLDPIPPRQLRELIMADAAGRMNECDHAVIAGIERDITDEAFALKTEEHH